MEPWILASSSPQRSAILRNLGVVFDVIPSTVDEEAATEIDPGKRALHLGELKAQDVASKNPGRYVIGCDTLVVASDGTRLEKPVDEADARRMLRLQSGAQSLIHSGLAIATPDGRTISGLSTSSVRFRALSDTDIDWWIQTGLWKDRSGSFQIDGLGQLMIENLEGDFTGVVGLPVYLLGQLAAQAGRPIA